MSARTKVMVELTQLEATSLFSCADNTLMDGPALFECGDARETAREYAAALRAVEKLQAARHKAQDS